MIDINYFFQQTARDNHANATERCDANGAVAPLPELEASALPRAALNVTFRGIVYPWHLDHMGHMNVRHYVGAFDQASWIYLALLGLDSAYFKRHGRGMAALEQKIEYKSELRRGEGFEIRSQSLEVKDKTIRMQHDMHKLHDGALAASTTILGVHLDTVARRAVPLPPDVADRAHFLNAATLTAGCELERNESCEPR